MSPGVQYELQPNATLTLPANMIAAILQEADQWRTIVVLADIMKQELINNGGLKPVNQAKEVATIVDPHGQEMKSESIGNAQASKETVVIPDISPEQPVGNA